MRSGILLSLIVLIGLSGAEAKTLTHAQYLIVDRDARLALAAEAGDLDAVNSAIAEGAHIDPDARTFGYTPLMWASQKGHLEIVERLLNLGARVNQRTKDGDSALLLASTNDQPEVVLALVAAHAQVNVQNKFGWTPLYCAVENGETVLIRVLLDAHADGNGGHGPKLYTPLMEAASVGAEHTLGMLLDAHVQINRVNYFGYSALHLAAQSHSPETVAALLKAGADSNIRAKNGMTALMIASREGNAKMVTALLLSKAQVNAKLMKSVARWGGGDAVLIAADKGNTEVARLLIEAGGSPNTKAANGETALTLATEGGHLDTASTLRSLGAK